MYQPIPSTAVRNKTAKNWKTHKSSASGSIAGCGSCPVETANDEEDHANKRLAGVDNDPTAKPIGGEGPEDDGEKVAAANKEN